MKILIQFATRDRPKKFLEYLFYYLDLIEDKENYMVHVSCDTDDLTMNNDKMKELISYFPNTEVSFNNNKTKIEATNFGVTERKWDIVLNAADDMLPQIRGYDNIIREQFRKYFPNGDGVLHFNDGYSGENLNTLSIMDRKYYDGFEFLYNPIYISFFADNEFNDISRKLGRKVYIDQVIIKHEHPNNFKGTKVDDLYERNLKYFESDRVIYMNRRT